MKSVRSSHLILEFCIPAFVITSASLCSLCSLLILPILYTLLYLHNLHSNSARATDRPTSLLLLGCYHFGKV